MDFGIFYAGKTVSIKVTPTKPGKVTARIIMSHNCDACTRRYGDVRMNACSIGPHFRDVSDVTDKWYMFTPIDLSVDGIQTFDLIGGDMHVIGQVNVLVENGEVTVTYELANKWIKVKSEFLTFFGSLDDVNTVDSIELTGYAFGEPVSIADELGGDTKVLLYIHNGVVYDEMGMGIREFYHRNPEYLQYVEELKLLMD